MTDSSNDAPPFESFSIERSFDAPIERVWAAWTDPAEFGSWYGPPGATIPVAEMDVTVGGKRRICMEMDTPNGSMQMWFAGEYIEIQPHTRLVYSEVPANADGTSKTAAEMGMPDGMSLDTQVIVELTGVDGATKMAMTHRGVPADSPGGKGWSMAIDKLAARLSETA